MDLKGRVAIVSGASRGIGKAIAEGFAKCGANVALLYNGNEAAARDALNAVKAAKSHGIIIQCDVKNFSQCENAVKKTVSELGRLDILVNNAGIVKDGLLLKMTESDFDDVLNTNLKGAFNLTKQAYPIFMRQRSGRIINISSVSGLMGNAGQANYSASKAGLIGFTKSVARELAPRGITCNAIAPGFIETDMTDKLPDTVKEAVLGSIPMRSFGLPSDIADTAVFLAGDAARYITGEVIKVDGGLYI